MKFFARASGVEAVAKKSAGHCGIYSDFSQAELSKVSIFHKSMDIYRPTPLHRLQALAKRLVVSNIYVKDESFRFGLNAYKGLGGVYAVARVICRELGINIEDICYADLKNPKFLKQTEKMTFVTATDGNHGNSVAWAATQFGCSSYVYMPRGSSKHRVERIKNSGATSVEVIDLVYDDTVRHARRAAEENNWFLVQDTAWEDYTEIPTWIAQGYTTLAAEIYEQLQNANLPSPTHVFLQAGVGSFAGAISAYLHNRFRDDCPAIGIVEPASIACFYHSVRQNDGKPHAISDESTTIMAGLNCGEPSAASWPIIRDIPSHFFSCDDFVSARGMRFLGHPLGGDPQVISGESGAVGLGLLTLLMERDDLKPLRESFGLNEGSCVLIMSTEGNTDPAVYDGVVFDGLCPTKF
jgi:diaminopropionate ammonia-lyase